MTSAVKQAYGNTNIDTYLLLLSEHPTDAQLAAGFKFRARFVALFTSEPPARLSFDVHFKDDYAGRHNAHKLRICSEKVVEQSARQLEVMRTSPKGIPPSWLPTFRGSLVGGPASKSPFGRILSIPEVDEFLLTYLKIVSSQMGKACRHNAAPAWPVVYIAAKLEVWNTLDPLRKAEAVLKAKEWREVSPS